ncbi:MAG: L-threonylcarbamoyladenylate synthase [Solirubrobacteraceae bacterium]
MGIGADFERCIAGGGIAVFPSDTVYGLACDPDNPTAVARMYALKGRALDKPAAVMRFALDDLPPLEPRTEAAAGRLLPGPVTVVVGSLGLRVPDVPLLRGVRVAVLQTSANHAGGPDVRCLEDVPADIRAGADLVIDGGELPGTPSTVVDLTRFEDTGEWAILREGALSSDRLRALLGGSSS